MFGEGIRPDWLALDIDWTLIHQKSGSCNKHSAQYDQGQATDFDSCSSFEGIGASPQLSVESSFDVGGLSTDELEFNDLHQWLSSFSQDTNLHSSLQSPAQASQEVLLSSSDLSKFTDKSTTDSGSNASSVSYSPVTITTPPLPALSELMASTTSYRNQALKAPNCLVPQPAVAPYRSPKKSRQTCTICKRTFGRPSDLERHMQDMHEYGAVYRCTECRYAKFGRKDKVQEHYRRCHGAQIPTIPKFDDPEAAAALHASRKRKKGRSRS